MGLLHGRFLRIRIHMELQAAVEVLLSTVVSDSLYNLLGKALTNYDPYKESMQAHILIVLHFSPVETEVCQKSDTQVFGKQHICGCVGLHSSTTHVK